MFPRWHVILGTIFIFLFWLIAPATSWLNLLLIFFGAVFIDFDHYAVAVMRIKKFGLKDAFDYHKKQATKEERERARGIRKKGDFHLFHTVEFHIIVLLLGYLWTGFWYILVGMLFHSIVDVIDMSIKGVLYKREYFFFNWLIRKIRKD